MHRHRWKTASRTTSPQILPSQVLDFPADAGRWAIADWVEKTMLLEEISEFSRPSIERRFPTNFQPDASEIELLYDELQDRAASSPGCYPFQVADDEVTTLSPDIDKRVYEFLTLASFKVAPYRSARRFEEVDSIFDLLVREAAKDYGGTGTDAVRFGWPINDGRPGDLRDAFPWLSERTKIPAGDLSTLKAEDKDAGVDVVSWKPFPSGGPAFSVTLYQNTVALNYRRKASDIAPGQWQHLLRIGTPPQIGLAVPFAIEHDSPAWDTINWRANVALDRLRLCAHLDLVELKQFEPEWAGMADFNRRERHAICELLTTPAAMTGSRARKSR